MKKTVKVHANSSVHYLKRRRDELDRRLTEYKNSKIDLINLAEQKQKPKIINKYVEEVRSGVKEIPGFIKSLPPDLAGDIDYLKVLMKIYFWNILLEFST